MALAVVVALRQPLRRAVVRTVIAFATTVLAFFVGKDVVYGIEYPGMPYGVDPFSLGTWLVLALMAGAALGPVFRLVGRATGGAGARRPRWWACWWVTSSAATGSIPAGSRCC
ncbi:hypothetical protein B0I33_102394 [Prauserella shujinwangii]|uniref:Uncharacterized protein n=1 Tax=Prauserella shujinwangii TaxID=1453103 RepID=A0A2T0M106_9PSEU|nr:hypothetical protein [Prauserella shujinwangii]PRX50275.1 hypothetical protein B0I33_102394 [Prauserella shujinwangii]